MPGTVACFGLAFGDAATGDPCPCRATQARGQEQTPRTNGWTDGHYGLGVDLMFLSFAGWALQQSAGSSSTAELKLPGNLHPGSSSHISQDFPLKVCRLQGRGAQNTLRSHPGWGSACLPSLDGSFPITYCLFPRLGAGSSPHLIPWSRCLSPHPCRFQLNLRAT